MGCLIIILILLAFIYGARAEYFLSNGYIAETFVKGRKKALKRAQKIARKIAKRSIQEAKKRAEYAKKIKTEQEARKRAEYEKKRKAEQEARKRAEYEKKRKAEQEARKRAEYEKKRKAEQEARKQAEYEKRQEEERKRKFQELQRKRTSIFTAKEREMARITKYTPVGTKPSALPPRMQPDNIRPDIRKKIEPKKTAAIKGARKYRGRNTKKIGVYGKTSTSKHAKKQTIDEKKLKSANISDETLPKNKKGEKNKTNEKPKDIESRERRERRERRKQEDAEKLDKKQPETKKIDAPPVISSARPSVITSKRVTSIPVIKSRTDATFNYKFDYNDPGKDPAPENQLSYTSPYRLKDEGFSPYDISI